MTDRQQDLDKLQRLVGNALAHLGKVSVAASCVTLRRVTIENSSGVSLRVLVGMECMDEGYFVARLRIVDDHNSHLTYVTTYTIHRVQPGTFDLAPLVEKVREALEVLTDLKARGITVCGLSHPGDETVGFLPVCLPPKPGQKRPRGLRLSCQSSV